MFYKDYLKSDWWKNRRNKYLIPKKRKLCAFCGSPINIIVHHRRYSWKGISVLNREVNKNLTSLCKECHKLWHEIHGNEPTLYAEIKRIKKSIKCGVPKMLAILYCGKEASHYVRVNFKTMLK